MGWKKTNQSVSKIYAWGFPINISLELIIQFVSLMIPIFTILKVLETGSIIGVTFAVLVSLYIYPMMILLLGAIATRMLPKPRLGYLRDPRDQLKFQVLAALSKFIRRTPARWLLIFPFPAYQFYKIAGARIDISAFQSSADSIPDVYLVSIGKNTLLGWNCVILGHFSPDAFTTFLGKVEIGNNVLIGESVTLWPNVKIGDNSIIQNKSVVFPGTIIPSGEIWGGIPAKKIRSITETSEVELVNFSTIDEDLGNYLKDQLKTNHKIDDLDQDQSLLSLNLSAEDIASILRRLEKRHDIFIDRTKIDITQLSFNQILDMTNYEISKTSKGE